MLSPTAPRAVRPAIAGVLLGVRPYELRQLLLCGELRLLHVSGRPRVGIPDTGPRTVAGFASLSSRGRARADLTYEKGPAPVAGGRP